MLAYFHELSKAIYFEVCFAVERGKDCTLLYHQTEVASTMKIQEISSEFQEYSEIIQEKCKSSLLRNIDLTDVVSRHNREVLEYALTLKAWSLAGTSSIGYFPDVKI